MRSSLTTSGVKVKVSEVIGPAFYDAHMQIVDGKIDELVAKGGRGSLKSSFCSVEVILQLLRHPECHALVTRQVADTLRDTVYTQMCWAIDALGLAGDFKCTLSPLQCTYTPTGQRILFRGLDDVAKIKGIKVPFGHIGIVWFEEADQIIGGEAKLRSVKQSALRGGAYAMTLISFNPPASARNWANQYAMQPGPCKLVHHSTYLQVPAAWLGAPFIAIAKDLKVKNVTAYRHEYLGEIVGSGTQVFENLRIEEITDVQIGSFDRLYNGVDWGWYPDPWAFNRMHYDAGHRTLYLFAEATLNRTSNKETAAIVKSHIKAGEKVTADNSENKSVADYRSFGIHCSAVVKGPGSVPYSMKWLQGLSAIVIDPARCPHTAKEFSEYEYEMGRDGEVEEGYPDYNNHHIDAVRYALYPVWKRRGQ